MSRRAERADDAAADRKLAWMDGPEEPLPPLVVLEDGRRGRFYPCDTACDQAAAPCGGRHWIEDPPSTALAPPDGIPF